MPFNSLLKKIFAALSFSAPILAQAQVTPADRLRKNLSELVKEQAETGRCKVILKAVLPGGAAFYTGYDGRSGKPVTDFSQTVEIGSCSKLYTAAAIHQLIEKKKISLNSKLVDLIPERDLFAGMLDTGGVSYLDSVKLYHLLNHSSGFDDYFMKDGEKEVAVHGDSTLRFTPRQLIRLSSRLYKGAAFKTGTRFGYSNVNYILLGMIIEKYSGMKYQQYINKYILHPLGLRHTWFGSVNKPPNRAPGHWKGKPSEIPATFAWSAGEMLSTLDDMQGFVAAWYRGKTFHLPATRKALFTDNFNDMGMGIRYGMGIIDLQGLSFGHSGETFGFSTYMGACENGASFALAIDDADVINWSPAMAISALLSGKKSASENNGGEIPYRLLEDSLLARFNVRLSSKKPATPEAAMELYAPREPKPEGAYEYTITVTPAGETIFVTDLLCEGQNDDSVEGLRVIIVLEKKEGHFRALSIRESYRCQPGRGPRGWTTEKCR